jgi:hypothetical protein
MNSCLEKIGGSVLLSAGLAIRPGVMPELSTGQKLKILLRSIVSPSKPIIKYMREGMVGLDDPLFTFRYTLRFIRLVRFEDLDFPERLDFPVFVGIGDSDELFSIDSCRELFEQVPSDSKEFYVAEGARHAVFPEGSWNPLVGWVDVTFD